MLGLPGIAVSQQSTAREMDFRLGKQFEFEAAAAFTARMVEEIEDVPLPGGTLLNVNFPGGEIARRRGRAARQADLPRRAGAAGGAVHAAPVPDLRRRARLRAPGGNRPRRGRGRAASRSRRSTSTSPTSPGSRRCRRTTSRGCWSPPRARSNEPGGARRGAAVPARVPRPPLLRPRRPRDRRRRLRRAARRAARDRGRASRAADAGLADPAGRRHADLEAREGRPPAADALARQRPLGRRAARLDRAHALAPRARGDRGSGVRVRRGAQDRRPGDLAGLPRRRARARRHARQRRDRRGRHAQPAHDPVDPAADRRRAAAGRGARRGLHGAAGLHGAQRAPREPRASPRS